MTIRKNFPSASRSVIQRNLVFMLALTSLAGCSSVTSFMEPDRIDYKSADKVKTPKLDIPPDLTQLQRENRYAIPDSNQGTATASGYNLQQGLKPAADAAVIAPNGAPDMRIERDGSQRWLVIQSTPEKLWPKIKDFWQDSGFLINTENPETGVMETDWAENRAKIPQDFLRNTLGKVFDSIYSTGERDKFRTRLERGPNGTTEVYISHRGAEEVLTGSSKETSIWTARPEDPQLEAEFLSRLMLRLGADQVKAKAAVATAPSLQARSKIVSGPAGSSYVLVDESVDRAWRRVGLALDRVGFTVEDRDRTQGVYFVRYVDQSEDIKDKKPTGFLSKMFSSTKKEDKTAARYRVAVKADGAASQVAIQNNAGQPETSPVGGRILSLLNEQLK
ncbi:outer membrane protein assembly factor BamC [Glaciimonas immobilis]|uniref:Outer membrane protein assembly factor BamC n=1 Tax=Glaciimonas immobilis TaxID=728004 RepID=A0A840RZV2_9BURK|nr:outer membrane protein assembly factor BamC [Glaciimonas immobilis]KAF3998265.1 outer membrane protein assembly factor BamC [Glaciimonas immobilis]MBB5201879.1 outer membrane protein assembly factor BamC [Glaciimonas immobilis]